MRKTFLAILLALALVLIPAGNAFALTTADVDVTATPAILSFDVAPLAWDIDNTYPLPATTLIKRATTYYSNPLGETTAPAGANPADAECRFTFTNDGDVEIDIDVRMGDFDTGMANSELGYDGVPLDDEFGASGYISGLAFPGAEVDFTLLDTRFIDDLPATGADTIMWGIALLTQPNSFINPGLMTSTVTVTATES